jgi:hypothetical protein
VTATTKATPAKPTNLDDFSVYEVSNRYEGNDESNYGSDTEATTTQQYKQRMIIMKERK